MFFLASAKFREFFIFLFFEYLEKASFKQRWHFPFLRKVQAFAGCMLAQLWVLWIFLFPQNVANIFKFLFVKYPKNIGKKLSIIFTGKFSENVEKEFPKLLKVFSKLLKGVLSTWNAGIAKNTKLRFHRNTQKTSAALIEINEWTTQTKLPWCKMLVLRKGRRHRRIFKFRLSKPGRSIKGHNLFKDLEQCATPARTEDHGRNLEQVPYMVLDVRKLVSCVSHIKNYRQRG
jgi:hypothetical protein